MTLHPLAPAVRPLSVFLIDPDPLARSSVIDALAGSPGIACAGTHADWRSALPQVRQLRPSLLLADVPQPGTDLADTARGLAALLPTLLVVFTARPSPAAATQLLRAGARGYLSKEDGLGQLTPALPCAAAGNVVLATGLGAVLSLMSTATSTASRVSGVSTAALNSLTVRELLVLKSICRGSSTSQVASDLHITVTTTRSHLARAFQKLGAHNRQEAAAALYASGEL